MYPFLSKKLKRSFEQRLKALFPQFEKVRDPQRPKVPLYRAPIDGSGHVYVALEIDRNAYTVELAWAAPGASPWSGPLEVDLEDAQGPAARLRPPGSNGWGDYWWNVVTGGEGVRADRPRDRPEDWTLEAMQREASEKPDPDMPERVDDCVEDTMRTLAELLPRFVARAKEQLDAAG
jgi:hypothetical protein